MYAFILFAFSFVTRFLYFGWPSQVVFDEVYNGRYVTSYFTGHYYFDVHPPLGKLLVALFAYIIHIPTTINFSSIGNELPFSIILLRLVPIIAGSLIPIIIYYICREWNFSKLTAFAAGALIVLENSLVVQSRAILLDNLLLLFGFGAILVYLIYVRKGNKWLVVASALLAGMAFSIKWTGMAYPLFIVLAEWLRVRSFKPLLKTIGTYAALGLLVYMSAFAIHFSLLNKDGDGSAFMTDRFQKTLAGNPFETATIHPKKYFGKLIELNIAMYDANLTLTHPHAYSSSLWTWPLMIRPIFYWQGTVNDEKSDYIYLLGNPLVYWLSTLSVLFLLFRFIFKKDREKTLLFILIGYIVNYAPFIFIGRIMFLYHYEAALLFAIMAIAYILERYVPEGKRKKVVWTLLVLVLITFIFFAPLTYGTPLSNDELYYRMWLPTWR